jgi:putative endonuclease
LRPPRPTLPDSAGRPPAPPLSPPPDDLSTAPSASGERRASLGRLGEDAAASHLAARGYRIVARNVRADRVEIDLIARRGSLLVFVEVKSRRGGDHALAAEAVDPRKQRRLRRGALAWLASHPPEANGARQHRLDVVTCVLLDDRPVVDAPQPATRAASHGEPRNATSAPEAARWSIEHWESAF